MVHRPAITILALTIAANLPVADGGSVTDGPASRQYAEDFESFLSGNVPSDSWYGITTMGSGTHQVSSSAPTGGDKDWKLSDAATGYAAQMRNTGNGVDLCQPGQTFGWQFQVAAPTNLGTVWEMRATSGAVVGTAQPVNSVGVSVSGAAGAETLTSHVRGSGAATTSAHPLAYTAGTLVNVQISQVNCGGTAASAVFTYSGAFTLTETVTTTTTITGDLDRFTSASTGTVVSSTDLYLDALAWDGAPIPAPTISTVNPSQGLVSGGNPVTITGTGFKPDTTVAFDGQDAAITSWSASQLVVTVPAHAAGQVDVVATNQDGQAATKVNGYQYNLPPAPVITGRNPASGPVSGGNIVNVTGSNFDAASTVTVDTTNAPNVEHVSASLLRVTMPPHAAGPTTFQVCNPDAQCDSATYSYVADPAPPPEETPEPAPGTIAFGPPRAVGQPNMDNNYGAYAAGDLVVLAHTVDGSGILVIETSTDAGATFVTRSTGLAFSGEHFGRDTPVVAQDSQHIYVVDCNSYAAIRTTDGINYAAVALPNPGGMAGLGAVQNCALTQTGTTLIFSVWQCVQGGNNRCEQQHYTSTPHARLLIAKSTDFGATWTTSIPVSISYYGPANGGGCFRCNYLAYSGADLVASSPTAWTVYYSYGAGTGGNAVIASTSTTDSGTTYSTPVTVNDQFAPIGGFGFALEASEDGTAIAFLSSDAANTYRVAMQVPGGLWSFVPTGTTTLHVPGPIYACGDYSLAIRQGASGQDRVFATKTIPASPTTTASSESVAITGATATASQPFTSYRLGDDISVVYGAPNGQIFIKTTPGAACPFTPTPANAIGVSASVEVPGLIGFDVDHTGSNVIVRQVQPNFQDHKILTFSGTNLSPSGTADVAGEDCGLDGVAALLNVVGWWDCENEFHGTTMFPGTIEIRSPDLTDPSWFPACNSFCHRHMEMPQTNVFDIAEVYLVPFDYTVNDDSPAVALGAAYSTLTGKVGATIFVQRDYAGDRNTYQERLFDASTNPVSSFCTGHNKHTGKDYLAAASPGATTKVYEVRMNPDLAKGKYAVSNPKPTVFLSESPLVLPQQYSGGDGIACGQQWIAVTTGTGLDVYDAMNRSVAWSVTGGTTSRGVTVSGNGECIAYYQAGNMKVAWTHNGTVAATIPYSLGDELLNKMALDSLCQVLFVAVQGPNGRIDKFVIAAAMGTEGLAYDEGQGVTDENDPSNPDFKGAGAGSSGNGVGGTGSLQRYSGTTRFIFGLILVAALAGIGYFLAGPAPMVVGGLATLGVCAAVAFGFFEVWVPIIIAASGVIGFAGAIAKRIGGSS